MTEQKSVLTEKESDKRYLYFSKLFDSEDNRNFVVNANHKRCQAVMNDLEYKKNNPVGLNCCLRTDLAKYSTIIDNMKQMNNYSVYIRSVCKSAGVVKCYASTWKSSLTNKQMFSDLFSDRKKRSSEVTKDDINQLVELGIKAKADVVEFKNMSTKKLNIHPTLFKIIKSQKNHPLIRQDRSVVHLRKSDQMTISKFRQNCSDVHLRKLDQMSADEFRKLIFEKLDRLKSQLTNQGKENRALHGMKRKRESTPPDLKSDKTRWKKGLQAKPDLRNTVFTAKRDNVELEENVHTSSKNIELSHPLNNSDVAAMAGIDAATESCLHKLINSKSITITPLKSNPNRHCSGDLSASKGKTSVPTFRSALSELTSRKSEMNAASKQSNSSSRMKVHSGEEKTNVMKSKFIPPFKKQVDNRNSKANMETEQLKHLDSKLVELIKNEIMTTGNTTTWDDIVGLTFAKKAIQEIVVFPLLRPDIFTGLRRPAKGILLFGPPGTGKTLIGKCIASQSSSTFFSISASSLTSKWLGDSEKLVRTLFAVARCHQPAVIFIDEIDSLLSQRNDTEHESSRRMKTEFLVQLDGATTVEEDRILVIGATNRPQELDEAARRRLTKRLYIPLPEMDARRELITKLMMNENHILTIDDIYEIACRTDGYSGADIKNLCHDAAMGPVRTIDYRTMQTISSADVPPVALCHFLSSLKHVKSSISPSDLNQYLEWDKMFGCGS